MDQKALLSLDNGAKEERVLNWVSWKLTGRRQRVLDSRSRRRGVGSPSVNLFSRKEGPEVSLGCLLGLEFETKQCMGVEILEKDDLWAPQEMVVRKVTVAFLHQCWS